MAGAAAATVGDSVAGPGDGVEVSANGLRGAASMDPMQAAA